MLHVCDREACLFLPFRNLAEEKLRVKEREERWAVNISEGHIWGSMGTSWWGR